jgi:hypothetical protein
MRKHEKKGAVPRMTPSDDEPDISLETLIVLRSRR